METALCLTALVLLALLAFLPVVAKDKVPAAIESIFFQPPWEEARPEGVQRPNNPEATAQADRYFPWNAFIHGARQAKDSLLWDPLEGCGIPFLAVWRTRCLSPFSLPFRFLPLGAAIQVSVLLKLIVAGWCAFYAARRFGFPAAFALAAGVAFEFSGHIFLWNGHPISDVVPWLPLLLITTERLVLGQRHFWPVAALIIGLMALGGDPETLSTSILFALIYLLLRVASNRTRFRDAAASTAVAMFSVIFGLALVAVQIVPFVEFIREAASTGRDAPTATLRLRDLVVCYLPNFFGKAPGIFTEEGAARTVQVVRLLHFGLIQLWLLVLWLSLRSFVTAAQRRRLEAMVVTAVIMTILAIAAGRGLDRVPLARRLGPEHFLAANALVSALLCIAAAEEWLALNAEECKRALVRLAVFIPLVALLAVVCVMTHRSTPRPEAWPFWIQALIAAGFSAALFVLLGITIVRPWPRLMGYSLAVLTFVSLWFAFRSATHCVDNRSLFPETPFVATLKSTGERLGGSDTLKRWPLAGNGISQVYCPSGVMLQRQAVFFERVAAEPLLLRRAGAPSLLLTKKDIQGAFAGIRPMLAITYVFPSGAVLFRDLGAKPRAWVAYEWRVADALDPASISAGQAPVIEGVTPPNSSPSGPEAKVTVMKPETNIRVEIDVDGARPGMFILADTYYPGWKAKVDGEDTRILPADGLFRSVPVKDGKHKIEFYYDPFSFKLGFSITLAAAAVILIELRHVILDRLRRARAG
jgi:hypothetical protein